MKHVDFYNKKPTGIEFIFVVIVARYDEKWLFVRHKERATYEIPGGHINYDEDYIEAAKRELYEETGAIEFDIDFVSFYSVTSLDIPSTFEVSESSEIVTAFVGETTGGYLFFANIRELSTLPDFEMAETKLFERMPDNLTYPHIQPKLFEHIQPWLNLQSAKGEIWDIYDRERNLTGRTHRRGCPLDEGDYHLVVHVWIQNSKGEFLVTKRTPNKGDPNMWESTGGAAVTGEDSLQAAIREVKEETGFGVLPPNGRVLFTLDRNNCFCDIWLFEQEFDISKVVLQPGETCDAKWASKDEIRKMINDEEFVPFSYIERVFKETK